jgi:ABC-type transport system involved in cytochrome bd biosynthesis fused ATPase/permease subunit
MAGKTVADLNDTLASLTDELTVLTSSIKTSLKSVSDTTSLGSQDFSMKKDIREFNEKADTYDRQFEEEESRLQRYGGKTRKQTLQEFVLLFFFVAYGILTVALALYANRVGADPVKIIALMAFIIMIITALIIAYA